MESQGLARWCIRIRIPGWVTGPLAVLLLTTSLTGCTSDELVKGAKVAGCSIAAGGTAYLGCSLIANKQKKNLCIYAALATATAAGAACYFAFAYENKEVKDYAATKTITKYTPTKGDQLHITSLEAVPSTVSPGANTTIKATYYVMTPDAQQDIPITEIWAFSAGDTTKKPEVVSKSITIKPGTRQPESTVPVPTDAPQGAYHIGLTVNGPEGLSDKKETILTIAGKTAFALPGEMPQAGYQCMDRCVPETWAYEVACM
jgi:hypothetical protein